MSDYFAALAVRTLQPELAVQPRRRTPYEDSPGGFDSSDELHPVERAVAMPPLEAGTQVRRRTTPKDDTRTAAVTSGDRRAVSRRVHNDGPQQRHAGGGQNRTRVVAAHPTARIPEEARLPAARRMEANPGPPVHPVAVSAVGDRRASTPLGRGGDDRPASSRTPAVARAERTAAREPIVRIHIGRVDVRAVTNATPSQRAPRDRKTGLMTLDEYMRRRDGSRS
jgi:hypothetical protein